ncbi:hypothetical protein B0O99DRAFT_344360 [Bisporella sp. PMI_857]|nr:hypothetical protein B0O99DRAFT_344360 [Bisporella sp. PMI_857]
MTDPERVDLVIVGAGVYGLAAAKTYLQITPSAKIILFESASTLGGTWSQHRLYPGLKSNNIVGTYEFSDFPLDLESYNLEPEQHIPGPVLHRYLTSYAEHFGFFNNIRFDTKVQSAEHKNGGGWIVKTELWHSPWAGQKSEVFTSKLIVATGFTSDPFLPQIEGSESFKAPIFHFKDILKHTSTLGTPGNVCILGCTKSGWDAVHAYASQGKQVDWIIRKSGHGPTWMSPAKVTPFKKFLEKLVLTRVLTWFSPCIWGNVDGYTKIRSFLHKTAVGRFIVDKFWGILGGDVLALNNYSAHPETIKLKPSTNPMFLGASGLSILNYDTDIFDFVRNGTVRVHIADIVNVDTNAVNLSTGEQLSTSALVCCTGWKPGPPLKFFPVGADFGIPSQSEPWTSEVLDSIDEEIFTELPRLRNQPQSNPFLTPLLEANDGQSVSSGAQTDCFKLYRFIVPPKFIESRDLAFAGCMMSFSASICSEVQALWIAAHFDDKLSTNGDTFHETVLHNRFSKWRTPVGFGARFPDFAFDSLPYYDLLVRDLGLNYLRKRGTIANLFYPYSSKDYIGLVQEWLTQNTKHSSS